jgi:hypothetical protein
MEYVFLSTIDKSVVDSFKNVFKDKLLLFERDRFGLHSVNTKTGVYSKDKNSSMQKVPYTVGLEYLVDMIMLSKCDSFIGPLSFGSILAMDLNNNHYRNRFIFDLGVVQPDENNVFLGTSRYFTPYPPQFEKVIGKIVPVNIPIELANYLKSIIYETFEWVNTHNVQ